MADRGGVTGGQCGLESQLLENALTFFGSVTSASSKAPQSTKDLQKNYMSNVLKSEKRAGHERHPQGQHATADMPFNTDDGPS